MRRVEPTNPARFRLDRREYDNTKDVQRARVRKMLHDQKAEEELQLWLRRLRDEAYVEYRLEN